MGQYKQVTVQRLYKIVEVKARPKVKNCVEISLPRSVLRELHNLVHTPIFKIIITNEVKCEYYYEYNERSSSIILGGLKPGTYRAIIKPYTLSDFVDEFNEKIKSKHNIKLKVLGKMLIAFLPQDTVLATSNWRFEREHSGAVRIRCEYPSETREKLTLAYQLKRGEANIKILEYWKCRRRPNPETVTKVAPTDYGVEITYRKSKHIRVTYIPLINRSNIENEILDYYQPLENITFRYIGPFKTSGKYVIEFLDKNVEDVLRKLLIKSYVMIKKGISDGKAIREKIGKKIAISFLRKYHSGLVIMDPYRFRRTRNVLYQNVLSRLGSLNVRPDVLIIEGNELSIFEIKFTYGTRHLGITRYNALNEVKQHMNIIKRSGLDRILHLKLSSYGIIVVCIDHKRNIKYLIYERVKVGE